VEDQRRSNREKSQKLLEDGDDDEEKKNDDNDDAEMSGVKSSSGNGDVYVSLGGGDEKDVDYSFWGYMEYGMEFALAPVRGAFGFTCPPCEVWTEEDNVEAGRDKDAKNPYEWTWPITFIVAFLWVSLFSFVISAVVQRWCDLLNADVGFFGMAIVAVGAEIPDTIQSVTVAKRGYGAMAVSNCLGSQICNICLGLGLPWTISAMLGKKVGIHQEKNLQKTAFFQVGIVSVVCFTLLGFAIIQGENKASLTKMKGRLYLLLYAGVLITLAIMTFS
jgi:Ca2+/Na+ antiporter